MEKYILKYLSEFYYLKSSDIGNDGIYYTYDIRKIPTPIDCVVLVDEISKVFDIKKENSKKIINDWALSINPNVNLKFFWMLNEQLLKTSSQKNNK